MSLAPHQKCSHSLRGFSALLGTQAKCERHLGDASIRVGVVENVEKSPFSPLTSFLRSLSVVPRNEMVALYYEH